MYDVRTLSLLRTAVERQPGLIRGTAELAWKGQTYYCATGSLRLVATGRVAASLDRRTLMWAIHLNDEFTLMERPSQTFGWYGGKSSHGIEDMVERRAHVLKAIDDQLAVYREHALIPPAAPALPVGV